MARRATEADRLSWDAFARRARQGSLLATWGWGELKRQQGWQVERLLVEDIDRVVLGTMWVQIRRGPAGVAFAYAPRGPLVPDIATDAGVALTLIAAARRLARRERALVLKLDPEWEIDDPATAPLLRRAGLRASRYDIQHRKSYVVDLAGGADAVFARVKESTRRAIRRCERAGVEVALHGEPEAALRFHDLIGASARRNQFNHRVADYYSDVIELVGRSCPARVILAELDGELVSGMIALAVGARLVYLYGGNRIMSGPVNPAYAAQWAAIRWGIEQGCTLYDMWGIPNHEDATLPGFGYFEFKQRFNGRIVRHVRCQEAPLWRLGPLPRLAERIATRDQPPVA